MDLAEFRTRFTDYAIRSQKRDVERMCLGSGVDDTPYYNKVLEEICIDLLERIETMEAVMSPAEEKPEVEEKPPARPKFV